MISTYCNLEYDIELSTVQNSVGGDMDTIHYHNSYEIYILEKGKRSYLIGATLIEMKSGDVCFINPYEIHTTTGGSYKRHLISFKEEYLDRFFKNEAKDVLLKCFKNKKIHLYPADYNHLMVLFEELSKDTNNFIIFSKIMEILSNATSLASDITSNNSTITEVIKYISNNYKKIENLDEIANRFFISKFYLCRLFKTYTGISVVKYINTLKLQYACELLIKTKKGIDAVSEECGFNSPMYFSKIFKNMFKITPSQYRKINS